MASPSSMDQYRAAVQTALVEIRGLLSKLEGNGPLEGWTVSPTTDHIVSFNQGYQARLTSGRVIGNKEELRAKLREDLTKHLHNLTAVSDELVATNPPKLSPELLKHASERYNQRATVLARLVTNFHIMTRVPVEKETVEGESAGPAETWIPLEGLKDKSATDLLRILTRAIPVDPEIDEQLTNLLYVLIRDVHIEAALAPKVPPAQQLPNQHQTMRDLASSQEFRDAIAAHFAPLLRKLFGDKELEAFDEDFRNTYFSVFNYVQRYYWELEATQPPPTPAEPESAPPQPPSAPAAPPVPPAAPLITDEQISHLPPGKAGQPNGARIPVRSTPRVRGTGLE